jgi:predicted aspartyl protease
LEEKKTEIENKDERMMAMKTILNIEGERVKVIIDTGAATSVITNKLRKELDIPIRKGSNIRFILADGNKVAALGKTEIRIQINNKEIPIEVKIMDSKEKYIIIGNDILKKWNANIDFEEKILEIMNNNEEIIIPIEYEKNKMVRSEIIESDTSSNETEYTSESEELEYETGEEKEIHTIVESEENLENEAK